AGLSAVFWLTPAQSPARLGTATVSAKGKSALPAFGAEQDPDRARRPGCKFRQRLSEVEPDRELYHPGLACGNHLSEFTVHLGMRRDRVVEYGIVVYPGELGVIEGVVELTAELQSPVTTFQRKLLDQSNVPVV